MHASKVNSGVTEVSFDLWHGKILCYWVAGISFEVVYFVVFQKLMIKKTNRIGEVRCSNTIVWS